MGRDHHNDDGSIPISVSNSEFLFELAKGGLKGQVMWVNAFIGNPDGHLGWGGHSYEGPNRELVVDGYRLQNAYFSVAALRYIDGQIRRTKEHFAGLLALVIDDADTLDLLAKPSWILETSPGKFQVGFFLEANCQDRQNPVLCTALVTRMAKQGLVGGDLSGNNIARYVRLLLGQNQKPRESGHWDHVVRAWNPEARYSLEDAAAAVGVDLDVVKAELAAMPATAVSTGSFNGEQSDKLVAATAEIVAGRNLHDSINTVAASLVASGTHPGAAVNMLRGLMQSANTPKDARWQARFNDIPRSVQTAAQKYLQPARPQVVDPDTGEITTEPLFKSAADLVKGMRPANYIIGGYLEANALSVMFGPSGVGKSFIAIDMALHVAAGIPWHGIPVKKGAVYMIAGEGHNGLAKRVAAWCQHHNVDPSTLLFFVSRHAVQLSDQTAAIEVAAEIERMVAIHIIKPILVLIDTLARNFGPGDENSAKDVGVFITMVDTYLRRPHETHTMTVHHSGHAAERARGSSAIRAALDQEFSIESAGAGSMTLSCTKMKDAELPSPRSFRIEQLEIGQWEGEPITGALALPVANKFEFVLSRKNAKGERMTCEQVVKAVIAGAQTTVELSNKLGCSEQTMRKIVKELVDTGILARDGKGERAPIVLSDESYVAASSMLWIQAHAARQ